MNILKPQNPSNQELQYGDLKTLKEELKITYYYFENEEWNSINWYELELEHCQLSHIDIQKGKL